MLYSFLLLYGRLVGEIDAQSLKLVDLSQELGEEAETDVGEARTQKAHFAASKIQNFSSKTIHVLFFGGKYIHEVGDQYLAEAFENANVRYATLALAHKGNLVKIKISNFVQFCFA